jgi:hypothetical protein
MSLSNLFRLMETGHVDDSLVKVVVPSRRLIWLWIPKNAGGSISRALVNWRPGHAVPCELPFDSLWTLNPDLRDFRIVAFKRNPFSRIVSCWLDKIADPAKFNPRYTRKYPGLRPAMPFGKFVEWLNGPEGRDEIADPHWQSQHLLLDRATEIVAFEDLPDAAKVLGIKPHKLPHRNRHDDAARTAGLDDRPLLDWYDARSIELVRERYADDLARLGYDSPEGSIGAA